MRKAYIEMLDDSSGGSEEFETAFQREIKEEEEIIMLPSYRMWFRSLRPIAIGAGVIAGLIIAGSFLGPTLDFNNDDIRGSETFGTENDQVKTNPSQSLSPSKNFQPSPSSSEAPWDNPPSPRRKPKILIIMADDFGTGDVPAYWNSSIVDMPNLNRLGAKGVTFKDVHSTPLCAPSRFMLLSGLYAHRGQNPGGSWSLKQNSNQFRGKQQSIARMLKERANYHTFMAGKWHIGAKAPPNGLYDLTIRFETVPALPLSKVQTTQPICLVWHASAEYNTNCLCNYDHHAWKFCGIVNAFKDREVNTKVAT